MRRKGSSKCRNTEKVERARKQSEKGKHTHFVEGAIQINLSNNIVVSKKNSYDHNLKTYDHNGKGYDQNAKHSHISNDSSIRGNSLLIQNSPALSK